MEKTEIDISEFNLDKEYELFDIIYSISKDYRDVKISSWIVTGHKLLNSSDARCFNCLLMSYPISKFVIQVQHSDIRSLRGTSLLFNTKEEAIEFKKEQITQAIEKLLSEL